MFSDKHVHGTNNIAARIHPFSIQTESGARIQVKPGGAIRTVTITGAKAQTEAARVALDAIINPPTAVLTCEQHHVRHIIGPSGSTIKRFAIYFTAMSNEGDLCQ